MCDLTDETWLSTQPPEYQRSVWMGRVFTRLAFAEQAESSKERQEHLFAAAEFERRAYAATGNNQFLVSPYSLALPIRHHRKGVWDELDRIQNRN